MITTGLSLHTLPAAGALLGLVLAVAQAAQLVVANGYLALGMNGLALDALRSAVNVHVPCGLALGAVMLLIVRRGVKAWRLVFGAATLALVPMILVNAIAYTRAAGAPERGFNLLLITVDTLRADHLSAYGYGRETSPNIDDFAAGAVLFRQAMVQWPKTTPSMASMLSGTYPHTNGIMRYTPLIVGKRLLLLSEILKEHGYATAAISTHAGLSPLYGFDQGFEPFVDAWRRGRKKSRFAANQALAWLQRAARGGRFFLWVHYMDPHARYEPPKPFHEMYVGDSDFDGSTLVTLNQGLNEDIGGVPGRSRLGNENRLDYYVAQYDAEIRWTDENIGRLLDGLRSAGLGDETVVVFTADHGESLGEHDYYFEHGRLGYETCLRVPLILQVPGLPARIVTTPVELVSLAPTLLEVLGVPRPPTFQGKSFLPLLRGSPVDGVGSLFAGAGYEEAPQAIVRRGRWKLISVLHERDRRIMKGSRLELYDLENDPAETTNLADRRKRVVERLRRELVSWTARMSRDAARPSSVQLPADARAREQLRSLGYVQ